MRPTTIVLLVGLAGTVVLAYLYYANQKSGASGDTVSSVVNTAKDVGAVVGLAQPRGIRNNNPGNLDFIAPPATPWDGQVDSDGRFGIYVNPQKGVRAMAKQLQADQTRHGAVTLADLINIWAPPSENNTSAYVNAVVQQTGLGADDPVDLSESLPDIVAAIIQHENGEQPYAMSDIQTWVYS